nr:MAG TPA: hypothetical protein [Caudoviricetes sp.]
MLWLYHFKGLVTMFIEYHSEVLLDMIRYYFFIPILENSSKICKILFLYVLLLVKF